jgi:redox-sensitive bicupin YhaK (pirin superfamily)
MAAGREIEHVVEAQGTAEGAGAFVYRALPVAGIGAVDPFLLLDEFSVSPPAGFPLHPHRGFEIITYMVEGAFAHGDSAGNQSTVAAGGLQKITAGRGIEHSETPMAPGRNTGLQLWINLARAQKGVEPDYQQLQAGEVPVEQRDGATVRVLAGADSPIRLHTPALYLDVALAPGATFTQPVPADWQGFAYVLSGGGQFGANRAQGRRRQVLVFGASSEEGAGSGGTPAGDDSITVTAAAGEPLRFALAAGHPHREPVRWRGPFVD